MSVDRRDASAILGADGDRVVIERGGRRIAVRLPRHGVAALGGLLALSVLWSAAAAVYVAFHDTVVAELRRDARDARKGYEAQIADLRMAVERSRTRMLVERNGAEQRLGEIARRQQALERRQDVLAELADPALAPARPERAASFGAKPAPLDRPAPDADDFGAIDETPVDHDAPPLDRLSSALDRLQSGQKTTLDAVGRRIGERRRTLESVYAAAGVRLPLPAAAPRGQGGPLIPLSEGPAAPFDLRAAEIAADRAGVAALHRGLDVIPLRVPMPRPQLASGFGARVDPFLRTYAFHSGLDFRGESGAPVRATAAGRVVTAAPSGGYGNMVEIDHGHGLSTRFGHLSTIAVAVGDTVAIGATVGRVGSTGRSTGPHLHYETRVNGEAVNPFRFLNAGRIVARMD